MILWASHRLARTKICDLSSDSRNVPAVCRGDPVHGSPYYINSIQQLLVERARVSAVGSKYAQDVSDLCRQELSRRRHRQPSARVGDA